MKYTDLADKDAQALNELLKEKKLLLFKLKAKLRTMQLNNPNEIKEVKKDIARIQTAITAASNKA
ncbi:MAG: 50S ribosomal protein L29 [Epsilonproteobacteria bacterium]|nr:50S ribosomal protein L29 [Campylobacterota bacterium]